MKNVTFTQEVRDFTSYSFKPQLKTVGPKYGKLLGGIKNVLSGLDGNAAMDELNANGCLRFEVNGEEVVLNREDLLIDTAQMEGYVSEDDNGITVVLDTNLSEELLEEGFVREIISKVQTMRKEADFEVMDKIVITYEGSEKAETVFAKNADETFTKPHFMLSLLRNSVLFMIVRSLRFAELSNSHASMEFSNSGTTCELLYTSYPDLLVKPSTD